MQLGSAVGKGVYGKVYSLEKHKKLCVKTYTAEVDSCFVELAILVKVSHPNIVDVRGVARHKAGWMLVMKREDTNLEKIIEASQLKKSDVGHVALSLTRALHYLKGIGVLHKDPKPANVLMTGGQPRLCDFGLSQMAHHPYDAPAYTAGYDAPEMEKAGAVASFQTELWALGAIVLSMMTGTIYNTRTDVLMFCCEDMDFDAKLVDMTIKMLDSDPARRVDVETVLEGLSGVVPPVVPPLKQVYPKTGLAMGKYFAGVVLQGYKQLHEDKFYLTRPFFLAAQLFRMHLGGVSDPPKQCLYTMFVVCYAIAASFMGVHDYESYLEKTSNKRTFKQYTNTLLTASIDWLCHKTPYEHLLELLGKEALTDVEEEILLWGMAFHGCPAQRAVTIATFVAEMLLPTETKALQRAVFRDFTTRYGPIGVTPTVAALAALS